MQQKNAADILLGASTLARPYFSFLISGLTSVNSPAVTTRRELEKKLRLFYMLQYMKQMLIELDEEIAAKLEQVAPGRARRRSEFIRNAIRRALWELEEKATAEAYGRHPDSANEVYLDPKVWEEHARPRRKRGRQ